MTTQDQWLQLRFDKEHLEMVDAVGEALAEEGVFGLIRAGKINRSAVMRYLLEREYRALKQEKKDKHSKE